MRTYLHGMRGLALCLGGLVFSLPAQGQEMPAQTSRDPLILHARVREPGKGGRDAAADSYVVKAQFKPDDRPRAVFVIGEDEYKTEVTLPAFAAKELEPLGVRSTFVIADPKSPHDFRGIEALDDADLLVLSVRRRAPTAEQMKVIRRYIAAGKPFIGIRTACHAFDTRGKGPAGHAEWKSFDPDVLGGHYTGHHANNRHPEISLVASAKDHVILRGLQAPFTSEGSLYKVSPLADGTEALLTGAITGQPVEPVAWVNKRTGARVFYTSLGHPSDFEIASFRTLLRNAVFWALDRSPAAKLEGTL